MTEPLFAPVTDAPLPGYILCELCVRTCAALGYNAISANGRGDHKSVGPPFGHAAAADCVGCGSCHEACPTGCIPMEDTDTTRSIWGRTFGSSRASAAAVRSRPGTTTSGSIPRSASARRTSPSPDPCKRRVTSERLATPGKVAHGRRRALRAAAPVRATLVRSDGRRPSTGRRV